MGLWCKSWRIHIRWGSRISLVTGFIQLDLDANGLGICHPDYADFSNYSEQEAEICDGETYHIKDRIFSEEGSYLDTFTNRFGFDSLVVTHLKIRRASDTISFNICSGDTLIITTNRIQKPDYIMIQSYTMCVVNVNAHFHPCQTKKGYDIKSCDM